MNLVQELVRDGGSCCNCILKQHGPYVMNVKNCRKEEHKIKTGSCFHCTVPGHTDISSICNNRLVNKNGLNKFNQNVAGTFCLCCFLPPFVQENKNKIEYHEQAAGVFTIGLKYCEYRKFEFNKFIHLVFNNPNYTKLHAYLKNEIYDLPLNYKEFQQWCTSLNKDSGGQLLNASVFIVKCVEVLRENGGWFNYRLFLCSFVYYININFMYRN